MYDQDYHEDFVDSRVENNPRAIEFFKNRIREIYTPELGWSIGDFIVTPNPTDSRFVTVKVHLSKSNNRSR